MSLQSNLIQKLIALNTEAAAKVYDDQVTQSIPLPFIASTQLAHSQQFTLDKKPLFSRSTIRIAIFSRTATERDAIADAIRTALVTFSGMMGDTRVSSVRVETSADEVVLADGDNVIKGKGLDLFFVYY